MIDIKHKNLFSHDFNKPPGLYIHIPFCSEKCRYCDFYSEELKSYHQYSIADYLTALKREIKLYGRILGDTKLASIYWGGGTPSLISPEQLKSLMETLAENFVVPDEIEKTLEANPATLTKKKIKQYHELGINRLSTGVQSFCDRELKLLGRRHDVRQARRVVTEIKEVFANFNLDLMFALPGQKLSRWRKTLAEAVNFSPTHFSVYNLELEPGTPLNKMVESGELETVTEELDLEMYQLARKKLKSAGYRQYEISNFALPGQQSVHNKIYWHYRPYLGLGPAAHSFTGKDRFFNYSDLEKYISLIGTGEFPVANYVFLEKKDLMAEMMIMGLRLLKGISRKDFLQRFSVSLDHVYGSQINKLTSEGLLEDHGSRVALSEKGLHLGNYVFQEFI
ncbi:MAG: radical SAM family heme chaperone HemW [Bacillota bacterium]